MWNFITFQLRRMRELAPIQPVVRKPKQEKKSASKRKKEESELCCILHISVCEIAGSHGIE
jgi:hypothetical protein